MATQRVEAPISLMENEAVVIEEVMETDVPAMNTPESDIPSIPEE